MRIVPVWCRSLLIPGCLAISAGAEQMGDFGSDVEGTIQSVALRPAREDSPSPPSGFLMHYAHYEVVLTHWVATSPDRHPPPLTYNVYLAPNTPEEYLRPGQRLRVRRYKEAVDESALRVSYDGLQLITEAEPAPPVEETDVEPGGDESLVVRISEDDLNATPGMGAARAQEPQSFLKYQRFGGSVTTREEDDRVVALELEEKARRSKRADARAAGTRTAARLLLPLTLLLILVVAALAVSGRARRRSR